jgi:hypothetical protein
MRNVCSKGKVAVIAGIFVVGLTTHVLTGVADSGDGRVFNYSLGLAPADESGSGGGGSEDAEELAKQAQNPVAKLISVPFQNNFNFGIGPNEVTQWVLNVQPVIPISVSEDWNLITRTIMPIINQPSPAPGIPSAFGLGDINPTFFLSPADSGNSSGAPVRRSPCRRRPIRCWDLANGVQVRPASC